MGQRAARGAATTLAGQLLRVGIQVGGVLVMARLLTPEDYGLMAMVVVVIGLGELVRDAGLSAAAVQARTLSDQQRDNLFWCSTTLGLLLSVAVFGAAGVIASFYGDGRLVLVTQVLAVSFLVSGLAAQHRAGLLRDMGFRSLAVSDVVAQGGSLAVGVTSAVLGNGYWALVHQQLTQVALTSLLALGMTRWLPGRPRAGAGTRGLLRFGWQLTATQLLGYASRNVDTVVIGRLFGAVSLGVYSRAYQLLVMPLNQIAAPAARVALPVLSRLQDDHVRFGAYVLRGQALMSHTMIPFFVLACITADPLIPLLLGRQWSEAVPLFQVLVVAGVFQTLGYVVYWVFLSNGLTRSNLLFSLVTRPALVALVLLGANWGLTGVAAAYSLGVLLIWPLGLWWVGRVSSAPVLRMLANGLLAVGCYVTAGITGWAAGTVLGGPGWLATVLSASVFLATSALLLRLVPPLRREVRDVMSTVRLLRAGATVRGPHLRPDNPDHADHADHART